jgi:hypothetical protein
LRKIAKIKYTYVNTINLKVKDMKKIFVVILFSLLWAPLTFSYVRMAALWNKGPKRVGIFGDVHVVGEADVCHRDLFTPFLEQLAKKAKNTEFILEHFPQEEETTNPACVEYLSQYAFKYRLKRDSLTFILGDIRSTLPGLATMVRIYFLLTRWRDKQFNLIWPRLEVLQKQPIAAQIVLDEIASILSILKIFNQTIDDNTISQFFEESEQQITAYFQALEEFFKKYNGQSGIKKKGQVAIFPKGSLVSSFLLAAKQDNYSQEAITDLLEQYFSPLLWDVANTMFVKDIIESQDRVDTTLVYVGAAHAALFNKLLSTFGYTLDKSVSVGPLMDIKSKPIPLSVIELEKFFNALLE